MKFVIKIILCAFLLVPVQYSQAINWSEYLMNAYNRAQSTIIQLLPTKISESVSSFYYNYISRTKPIAQVPSIEPNQSKEQSLIIEKRRLQESVKTAQAKQREQQAQEARSAEEKQKTQERERIELLAILSKRCQERREKEKEEKRLSDESLKLIHEKFRLEQQKEDKQRLAREQERQAHVQEKQKFFDNLRKNQSDEVLPMLSSVSNNSITWLYYNYGYPPIKIPQEPLERYKENIVEWLNEHNIVFPLNIRKVTKEALENLIINSSSSQKPTDFMTIEGTQQLLSDAKIILKAFLPPHELSTSQKKYFMIKESAERRLYTYTKLKKVIEQKRLSHVHLPIKYLAIKDNKTGEYITDKKIIASILDEYLKLYIPFMPTSSTLRWNGPYVLDPHNYWHYDAVIFAEKIDHSAQPLNSDAFEQLQQLVENAPFDIGYGNIFSDDHGDAVIIDTEFKGEPSDSSKAKLHRYPHSSKSRL